MARFARLVCLAVGAFFLVDPRAFDSLPALGSLPSLGSLPALDSTIDLRRPLLGAATVSLAEWGTRIALGPLLSLGALALARQCAFGKRRLLWAAGLAVAVFGLMAYLATALRALVFVIDRYEAFLRQAPG